MQILNCSGKTRLGDNNHDMLHFQPPANFLLTQGSPFPHDFHITKIPWEGNGNPLQYSGLGNPMDRGAWQATVHGALKSRTRLSDFAFTIVHVSIYHLSFFPVFQLIYNVVLISVVQQSDSVIYIDKCVCVYMYSFFIFFSIMVHHRRLDIVPCVIRQDLVYPSYKMICIC